MKSLLPQRIHYFFLIGFAIFLFLPNNSLAQYTNTFETCPPGIQLPAIIQNKLEGDYDNRKQIAYGTYGLGGSVGYSVDLLMPWESNSLWDNCMGNFLSPPTSDQNQMYIQINADDFVEVNKLSVKNGITLIVCGYLDIKNFEETGESQEFLNNVRIFVCPGGVLRANELKLKNSVEIFNYGTMQVNTISHTGGQGNLHCITGTGTFETYTGEPLQPTIVEEDGTWYYNGNNLIGSGWTFGDDCTAGTLPIELLSFTPSIKPDRILLNWTTGSEINNDYFTIERSRDLYGWEVLGFVEGAGNSSTPLSYSFSDYRPLDGLAYYRLKQTDFDGNFKYYGPIAAHYDLGLEGLDFKVMKNFSSWVIAVPNDGFYQVEVYNLQGHRLHSERVENTLSIPAPEGAVVIRVTDGFEQSASRVVM